MKLTAVITGQVKLPALSLSTPWPDRSFWFLQPLPQLGTHERNFPSAFTHSLLRRRKTKRHLLLGKLAYLSILDDAHSDKRFPEGVTPQVLSWLSSICQETQISKTDYLKTVFHFWQGKS